ncbi:thiamine pyrophosphate-dependent enzyme [Synechococcus sp. AH-551-E05]|nr:thiamine pyrophosphate-dependent enzyme [Synechococcus sp. AH-551-E05]MDB4651310.1 thiamine pyrophosphate-dependent enzyme [Synechococcus sp. AH-551-E05]
MIKYPNTYHKLYKEVVEIRAFQKAIAIAYSKENMRCPIHLSIGQEFWLPILKMNLKSADRCFSSHRSHSMYLGVGGDKEKMILELLGDTRGCVNGKGGSMHLKALERSLEASVPIVGSSLATALGSALAAKHLRQKIKTVAYFGDGACEEGILHESLNIASIYKLPILFICENNQYSCNTRIEKRQPSSQMIRFARAHRIDYDSIRQTHNYSNIVKKISNAIQQSGDKPFFIEINSYRLYEHCGHKKDVMNGDRKEREYLKYLKVDTIKELCAKYDDLRDYYKESLRKYLNLINELGEN